MYLDKNFHGIQIIQKTHLNTFLQIFFLQISRLVQKLNFACQGGLAAILSEAEVSAHFLISQLRKYAPFLLTQYLQIPFYHRNYNIVMKVHSWESLLRR